MVNWEFFDNQTPTSALQIVEDIRAGRDLHPTRGADKVHTFKETERVLAGFEDGHADEGLVQAAPRSEAWRSRANAAGARRRGRQAVSFPLPECCPLSYRTSGTASVRWTLGAYRDAGGYEGLAGKWVLRPRRADPAHQGLRPGRARGSGIPDRSEVEFPAPARRRSALPCGSTQTSPSRARARTFPRSWATRTRSSRAWPSAFCRRRAPRIRLFARGSGARVPLPHGRRAAGAREGLIGKGLGPDGDYDIEITVHAGAGLHSRRGDGPARSPEGRRPAAPEAALPRPRPVRQAHRHQQRRDDLLGSGNRPQRRRMVPRHGHGKREGPRLLLAFGPREESGPVRGAARDHRAHAFDLAGGIPGTS